MKTTRVCQRGFSLVELVLVMLIIGIISAIAVPRFSNALERQRAGAAATRLMEDLQYAQALARAGSQKVAVEFDVSSSVYTIDSEDGSTSLEMDLAAAPYGASLLEATDFSGDTTVSFNAFGLPSSSGSVFIDAGGGTAIEIQVNESGGIKRVN